MKSLMILYSLFLLSSCSHDRDREIKEKISLLKTCNLSLFESLSISARVEREGKYIAFSFTKFLNDRSYSIPNFSYPKENALSRYDSTVIISYAQAQGIKDEASAYKYVEAYSNKVIKEYEKTGMIEIRGDLKIGGKNIIFYPDKEHFIAYVPDAKAISNEYWKGRFTEKNKVETQWYSGWHAQQRIRREARPLP